MKITVIGGGNIGTLMAGEMAARGHAVTIYTSKPEKWQKTIHVLDPEGKELMQGELASITSDMKEALTGAELIWVTMPAELFGNLGKQMEPYITAGQIVGVVPGSGGAEFAFRELTRKGAVLFGLQRVHSIARLHKYGEAVYMLGRKARLELGSIPANRAEELSSIVSGLFELPCVPLANYLCVTLTPSNPILHTTRLCTMFREYEDGVVYPRNFLFYEEWTEASSQLLIDCDAELQTLCERIPLQLEAVESLRSYYESPTAQAMTAKISGIKAFKGLTSPMVETEGGWIPDFKSRYFTTDFPYGLKIIKDLAAIYGVDTPHIQEVWDWYAAFDPEHAATAIDLTGLTKEEIEDIYR